MTFEPTKFYTIEQIAEVVEVSTRTVRSWIEKGLLVAHRINGVVRVSEADFLALASAFVHQRQVMSMIPDNEGSL